MRLVNIKPAKGPRVLIGAIPIIIALVIYAVLSAAQGRGQSQ